MESFFRLSQPQRGTEQLDKEDNAGFTTEATRKRRATPRLPSGVKRSFRRRVYFFRLTRALITAEVCEVISNARRFGGATASGVNSQAPARQGLALTPHFCGASASDVLEISLNASDQRISCCFLYTCKKLTQKKENAEPSAGTPGISAYATLLRRFRVRCEPGVTQEQSGTEAETEAGLNAARAVTGVESWPDEEAWLTDRVKQRQV
ncbi:unnamed protein product [Pleuronectes platessa]|uniref:Uncharacterized protein n=1 Tax=Pleuronectes platessa TaxID=8262 RepID=A0A9N7TIV0_PLEPL|nr:unnamed protein product [Pleuronectes platessa]